MKKGIKRDLWFVVAVLGVFLGAGGLSWIFAYLYAGPLPANQHARELYAEGLKKLFGVLSVAGIATVSVIYLWHLVWFTWKPPTSALHQAAVSDVARGTQERADDANLSTRVGWGILLGFVLIMALLLVKAALSPG